MPVHFLYFLFKWKGFRPICVSNKTCRKFLILPLIEMKKKKKKKIETENRDRKPLVGISPIGVHVQWIYPGSIPDSNIPEKSELIGCVEEEHEITSDKGFFIKFMSEE